MISKSRARRLRTRNAARGSRCGSPDRQPHVLTPWFPPESVYAIFDSRDEAEVVVDAFAAAGLIVNELTDEDCASVEAVRQKRREQMARLLAKTSRTGGQPTAQS
jgi:hypothetical protein